MCPCQLCWNRLTVIGVWIINFCILLCFIVFIPIPCCFGYSRFIVFLSVFCLLVFETGSCHVVLVGLKLISQPSLKLGAILLQLWLWKCDIMPGFMHCVLKLNIETRHFGACTFTPSRGRWFSVYLRPTWPTSWVPSQPELQSDSLSWETKKKEKRII